MPAASCMSVNKRSTVQHGLARYMAGTRAERGDEGRRSAARPGQAHGRDGGKKGGCRPPLPSPQPHNIAHTATITVAATPALLDTSTLNRSSLPQTATRTCVLVIKAVVLAAERRSRSLLHNNHIRRTVLPLLRATTRAAKAASVGERLQARIDVLPDGKVLEAALQQAGRLGTLGRLQLDPVHVDVNPLGRVQFHPAGMAQARRSWGVRMHGTCRCPHCGTRHTRGTLVCMVGAVTRGRHQHICRVGSTRITRIYQK
eukprot:365095-Chlamydomonas_euryale.AAC.1